MMAATVRYFSANVQGNLHAVVSYMNEYVLKQHPGARLIVASHSGFTSVLIYEVPIKAE